MSKLVIVGENQDELDDWANTSTVVPAARKRRIRVSAPISHDIFGKCAEVTTDPFWANIFKQAKDNKFPGKFGYKDGMLYHKHGQKISQIPLSLNPIVASKEFMTFLQDKGGIFSELDRKKFQTEVVDDTDSDSWSSLKKKYKDQSRANFVERERRDRNLTPAEVKQLNQILNYGFGLKYFNRNTITVRKCIIVEIEGLVFDSKTRKYDIDTRRITRLKRPPAKSRAANNNNICYDDRWFNYHTKIIAEALSGHDVQPKTTIKIDRSEDWSEDSDWSESSCGSRSSRSVRIKAC